jgi:tetratricopeptide (TPR) repeat protein
VTADRGQGRAGGRPCRPAGRISTSRPVLGAAVLLLVLMLAAACDDPEPAIARGDRLWADSQYQAALSEYRLAARGRDPQAMLRVAHTYAELNQVDRAVESYRQLLSRRPEYTDQAIFDLLRMARRSRARNDRHGLATAVETARELRPRLPLEEFALPLARHYARGRDQERALEHFERALAAVPPDSAPPLIFEIGQLHDARGDCRAALGYFETYRQRAPRGPRIVEARWHIGNCSFQLGREAYEAGEPATALPRLETVLEMEEPANLLDQAHFLRAEILFALGRREEALESYWRFLELTPTRSGQLVERAQQRIETIRFGF